MRLPLAGLSALLLAMALGATPSHGARRGWGRQGPEEARGGCEEGPAGGGDVRRAVFTVSSGRR